MVQGGPGPAGVGLIWSLGEARVVMIDWCVDIFFFNQVAAVSSCCDDGVAVGQPLLV